MKRMLFVLCIITLICSPAMAGKNAGGALVVHTDDAVNWTGTICDQFDTVVPQECIDLNTRTDKDEFTTALIWFIAVFPSSANPGVSVVFFGNDHNLPEFYHNRWGYCPNGTTGSLEVPDTGWPEFPATAGNSVAYGAPLVLGDIFFPVYYFDVWGFEDAYYCSGINPTGGYAAFVDDSNPPVTDPIELFGCVRWYEQGHNDCQACCLPGACCFDDGSCALAMGEMDCFALGGYLYLGDGTLCEPNPCPQPGACCYEDASCVYMLEANCYDTGGWIWFPDTMCEPQNPCPEPEEACCFLDGSCQMLGQNACTAEGGEPQGLGTNCDPNYCPQPLGGCCFSDGHCEVTLEVDCDGDFWIIYDDCDPNQCGGIPLGACCYGCEECVRLNLEDCENLPDDYLWIEGEDCDPNPCPPIATQTTTWGSIKADYR